MGKVKQKLLIVFLIVIAIVIGYQAYVIGHGYARTASDVPFMSGGVMIYCREHHNSFNYGDGTRGYAYACVGEVNLKNKNAHDFAYYISRGGTGVQGYLWAHSGSSQGATILNAGSSFSGWFEKFNAQNLFSEGAGNESGTSETNYNNTNTEKKVTLEDMRTDFSLKPVESMPEYFFKDIYADPNTQETTGNVKGDEDIKQDFVSQLYNDFLEETGTNKGNGTWAKDYTTFESNVKNKYADLIKKEYEEEEKAKGRENIPPDEIDSIKIDYTQIDAETKQNLINEMLNGTPYKHTDGNIDKIQKFLSENYSDETKKKAQENLLNDLNNLNITNDLEANDYDDTDTKKAKEENRKNFENHINAALTASGVNGGNAKTIVDQIIKEEKAIEMIEATINEISAKEQQSADVKIDQYITDIDNKFKNVGNNDTLQTDKQELKNAKLHLEYTILEEEKLDVEKANLQQQANNDVGKQAELKRVEEKIKRRDNIKKTLGEEALKNNYNYSLFYEDVVDHIQNALIQILANENMTAEEIRFLAEDVAYRIVEETIEDIEAEAEGLITDISYEEYKYLFELAKLYNHFYNLEQQTTGTIQNIANGEQKTIKSLLEHLNTYWDDGHGAEYRRVTNVDSNYNVTTETSTVYSIVDAKVAYGKKDGEYTNANGEEILYVEADGITYWGYADEVEKSTNGIKPKDGKHGAIYYEDNKEAVVSFFDRTLCLDNSYGTCIQGNEDVDKLEKYAAYYLDDTNGTNNMINLLTSKYPNLAKLLGSAQGKNLSNKINYLCSVYSNDIKNICKNSTSESGSIDQYYVFNHDSNSPLDYKWTGTVERASQIFQWLMQKNSDGVTNIEGIANRFRVDDSKAKFLIDAENGKYLIGPYKMEYASIRLNNEQILGINGFSVNIQVMDKDGKLHTEKLTEGTGKNQYKIVRSSTQRVQTDKNGIVSLPKSGSEFYIELDKDIKTELGKNGNYSFSADDIRLTENDKFSFSVSYKYLAGINAIIHLLRDCTGPNDAANPIGPDSQWNSGHPQRLIAITYGDEWKHTTASTEVNPVSYDFKLRKIKKLTEEEINTQKEILKIKSSSEEEKAKIDAMSNDQIIQEILNKQSGLSGVNGAEFVAAAKYKEEGGTEEKYFDLETQTKDLGSDFNAIVEKAKSGEVKTYLSASQAEGNGWILWNNIQDTITVNNKIYTLQKVEAKETKAPNGYKIEEDKVITIEKYGSRVVCAENEESTPPYTVTVRKVDETGEPIEGLNLEGWFLNLGVKNGVIATTNYGYYDRQKVTTDKNGIATFETDMYSDSVMLLIVEKPDKAYDYQYFKLVRVVFSATLKDGKVEKDFRNKSNDKPFLDTAGEVNNSVDFEHGVYSITDKDGVRHLGKEGKANDYVKTKNEITDNGANVDVQIVNKRRKPYSLEINKLDEFGKTSEYLAGTTFNFWISKDGSDLRSGQIVIGEDGKGKIDKLNVYGNNLFLYLQEVKTQTGFKTKLNNKTIVLKYSASEDGNVKIESIENKEMLSGRKLNEEPIKVESTGEDDDKTVSIKIDAQNESDKYYLKFRKVNRNGEPLKNATFTLTDKAPATAGSSLANSQTVTSDENGYMEFVGPEETENGKVQLYLYEVSAPAGYEVKSDTSIDNPIEISYTYKAGYNTLKDLKITYNGADITHELQCETKTVTTEDGTEQKVANLKNDNQYVFNFGDLNEIFKLVNYEDTYNLTFKKEDTKGNALGNTKFNVSIVKIEKDAKVEEVLGKILNNENSITGMDRLGAIGAMFATYEDQPSTYDSATKKYKDPVYQELKDKEISTSHSEGDGFENGTAVVEKIATYGDLYAVIKETEADKTHQKIDDIIIAHYTMNPGDTEPTWENDIYVAKKGEDGQYQITKYTKQASATGYTDTQGHVYEFAKYSESKLIVENQDLPYSLNFNKVNGISGKPVKDVTFRAEIYHLYKNDTHDTRTGKTGENGIFNINNIFKYSEDDSDIIQLELHETVPQGYRYYSQYQELIYIIDYVKKGPESPLQQQSVHVIGCRRDNGETVDLTDENKNTVNLDTNIATNNTQSGEGENQNAEQSKSYVHNVTVKNMPTYNLDGLLKVEEINRTLNPVTDVTFTGKIRKEGVNNNGNVVQEGQAYVVDGTKLDLSKFTIKVEENGKIVASGIDTCDDFVNDDGTLKNGEQTYTLVLTEQKSGKYKPLKHDIEVEYSCTYNQNEDKWNITYKKVKYGETTADIKANTSEENAPETPNYTALIDTEELGFYQNGNNLYVVNKPEITPAQILLQKKDEKEKLIDGITFKGKVEQINTIDGETPNVVDFSQDGVTTGEAKSADGKNLTGVAAIPNIDFGGDIKITIDSEEWKDKNKQDPLDFPEGKVEITGVKIAEKWEGNIGYRVVTVPTGTLTVTTYAKDGTKKEEETINIKDKSTSSKASFDVSFSEDSNVVTFYITNHNKRYKLDGSGADGSTAIPFPYKIEKDILGNESKITQGILFTGRIEDSNGNILQDPVEVKFTEYVQSSGGSADGNMGIGAFDIDGAISSKPGEPEEVYNLIIKEKDQSAINSDAITVRYTCEYDSSANNGEGKFTSKIKGYEYKNVKYDFDKNMQEAKDNIVPGKVDANGGLININDLYVPIRKFDEYGNLINGIVFEGKIKLNIEKDENGHLKDPTLKEEYKFKTVTGGQYYNPETGKTETAPDGVAVIPIPTEVKGNFTIIIEKEYWGTIKDGVWTTDKGELPDGQFPLEFVKGAVEIGGYGIKEEIKDDIKERTVTYQGTPVKYTLNGSEENSEPIEVTGYKAVTTDTNGYIRFVNNELRYDLKKSPQTGEGNNLFDDKFLETSYGYRTKIKEGIYFTGYIVDETKYDEKGNIIKPSVTLQEGRSTKDKEDKDKVTVALDEETGAIVATGIKGSIAGIDEEKTFKFVLEELSSNGEDGTLNVVPIDPIVVEYTCKYDRTSEKFETAIKAYEYKGKKYSLSDIKENITVEEDIIPGLVCVKEEESSTTYKTGLINHEKTIDIPLVKKDEAGRLVNGIKFTGKIIALDEEYKDENGKPVFETTDGTNNNGQPTTKRKSMNFEVVTGEVPTTGSIKLDGSQNNSEDKNFTDEDGNPMYTARDGVALIPQIPYTGKVQLIIEKEEWADEDYKPAPGDPDLEFIDGKIEVTFSISKDKNGEKHINYTDGMQIAVKDSSGQDITNKYMDAKNGKNNILAGLNNLGNGEKDFAFGISVTNKFKSYDVPVALKVIKEDEEDTESENTGEANTVTVGGQKYRQPTAEEAKQIKFKAEVTDSTGTVVQTLLPLNPEDMEKAGTVGIGIEVKDIDNDGKQEAVIVAKGIKGSIIGEDIIIKLHEVYSGGLEPIPDIKVHYKLETGEAKVTRYECNNEIEQCTENHDNNGTCKIKDLIYVSEDGKYALVNTPTKGPEETTPELTIKKVMNVDGHEVGVPGIYFKIRVCTEDCKNDCKDPNKCSCQEGEDPCGKCFDYEAISQTDGLTTFKLTDFGKDKKETTAGKVKVIILEERLATEEDKTQIKDKAEETEETSEDEKTAEVAPYTTEQPGEVKLEFIKNPIVINGIEIKNDSENGDTQCKVDYTNATVDGTNSNVSIDNTVGMQIVFTNKEATFDLDLFKGKMINYIGELKQIYKGVEFEADIVRAEDIKADNIAEVSLQHIVSTTDESTAENTGDNGNLATTGIEANNGKITIKGIKGTFASESNEEQQENVQQYAVVLREKASEISDAKDMPTMAIVFESKCTTGEDGKCTFNTTIKEYKWQDDNGWHTLNPAQNVESDENGKVEQFLATNRMLVKYENGKAVTYLVNTPPTTITGGGYLPTTVDIPLVKYDENGNLVNGVKFSGHIEVDNHSKMQFSTITGEVPTTTIANGFENVYVARDGVAIIPKIPFTGKVKVVIEKEEWASDAYKPSAGYPDLEFIDGKIEITLTIDEDEKGNKHIQQGGIEIAVKGKDDKDITNQYMDTTNSNNNKVLVGLNSLNKGDSEDNEELLFGIKITNKIKTYDLPIALKVIAEDGSNSTNGANTIQVGEKTYRTPSEDEAKELRFSAEVLDSTGTVVQNLLPLTPEQMQNADAVGIGIDTKGSDNKTEAVITAKGIKGSIIGDNLTIRLHEENSAGLEPIPDIDVHYTTNGDGAPKVTSYQCGGQTVENKAPEENGDTTECNIEDLIYVSEDGKYALVNKPVTGGGPKETTPELTIKKVINVDGHEVGVPGVHFKIRVCTPECKNDCTDVAKCGCENNDNCDKCHDYEAVSKAGGLATFELTDFSKDTTSQSIDNLKVIILEEKLATEEEKEQLVKEGVEPYTTENPGDVKLEFIKDPVTITGIKLKNNSENGKTQCTVDYSSAKVADENSNVRIDSKAGMQIVFTNTEAKYDLDLFDSKLVYEDNKLKQIYKGVEFEADIVRAEDINAENIAEKSLQHFVSETAKATANNTGKNGDLGTVGLDASDGKIKLKGIKGTLAGDNGQEYAVMLKETSSEVSDANDMPTMVIVYKSTCTTGDNGNCTFKTTIQEYKWQDDNGWHSLNPNQTIQTGENGNTEKNEIIVDGRIKIEVADNKNKVSLINDGGKIELSTSESIKLTKKDSNGNTVGGIEFKGKVIAINADGTPKKEAMSDENGNITGTKDIEYEFDVITDNKGTALIYTPNAKEMPKYEGKIKVVIEEEKWAASVTEPPYKLGFADETIEITGLELKTETTGQLKNGKIVHTRVVYPDTLTVKSYKKQEEGTKGTETNTYKDKVSLGKDSVIGIEIENQILDYDVDLFDAKILKYGEHYEQLKSDVSFAGRIIGYKGKESKQEAKDYDVEVELIAENDTTSGQQGTANGKVGKIVAKGIDGEIKGSDIYLELTETAIDYDVEDITVIIKYDYNPDAQGKGTPVIKEYRKWKDGITDEQKKSVDANNTEVIYTVSTDTQNADASNAVKEILGEMIYKNYSNTAKTSLINTVIPNPLDIQIKKIDSNGKPVAGIKFTGRIIAVDDSGNARKEKDAQGQDVEIKKEFTTAIAKEDGTTENLQWITSDSDGVARLHLTPEEVNKFAGKIKIEIDKEEWSTDEKDPLKVDPAERTPLDFIDGKIEITGKKIDVQKDKTSSLINENGGPKVTIKKDEADVTSNYQDRVNANVSNEIAISMKNIIKEYDLTLFDKKIIRVNGKEIQIKEGVVFTGEITHDNKVYPIDVEFNTEGNIVAKGINGDIVGENITLKVTEVQTISGIVPVDFDIVYSCSYNNGKFETTISKKTLKEHGTDTVLKEIQATDESGNVLEEDVINNDGITLKIRKVDENGNPVEGIKFTGKVVSRENTGKGGEKSFTASATDGDGIATITLTKDDITNYIKLGKFDVIIEKEEWNDATAKAKWQSKEGNASRELNFITSPVTISGYTLFEIWDGNNAHRSVDFSGVSCDNENITIEEDLTTIKFMNNDVIYNIPFIKTNKLLKENVTDVEKLKNVTFDISIKAGEGDQNPQNFHVTSDDNGRFDVTGVNKFGDITLTLREVTSEDSTAKILEQEMKITYKTQITDGTVTLTDIKVDGTPIADLANIQENENGEEQETKEPNIQYVEIKQNEKTVKAFNIVNHDSYKITIDKDLKVDDNVIDATEPVKFKGIITTNQSQVNGTDTIMSYKSFEEKLKNLKDTDDTIVFDGVTKNGKLEIPKDIEFYDKQVYVYFIEYDVPATMVPIDKVMWASFNKKESSVQSTGTSDDKVTIDNKDPLNINVKVVNESKSYKLNFKKVDAQDASRQINYQGAKFTLQLKEIANENGISKTKIVDTMTVEFDNKGKIKPQAQSGKYLVDATFEKNAIYVDVNKFGNLQLVITEDTAPTGYQKLDTDIVINYKANAQTSDRKQIITDVQVPDDIDSSIKDKINAKANPNGDDVSLEFTIPNSPNEYSVTIKKVSRTNPSNVLNNIHFQLLFYNNQKERLTEVEKSLYNVEKGTVTIDGLKTYGTNYMVLHETETDGKTVRLEGYHVFEMTAVVGKKATFKYLGMFKSDDMAELTIDEINNTFKAQDLGKLNKDMESYFKTDEDSVGVGSLSVGNDEPKNYSINVLKVDEEKDQKTGEYKPLEGAEFDLYLTRTKEEGGKYPDGDYQLEDNLLETKDRTQETAANGLISLTDLKQYSDQYGDLKLTLVESKTPKDYKSVFERIEIVYSTKDGNDITIKQIKVFGTDGKELGDYTTYVEISNANENEITNAEIDVIVKNIHKKPVSLSLSKIYYTEVNGRPTEKSIPGATFSGVVYEKGKPEDQTAFSATTDNSGNANLGEFYVEGDIEVVIEEISAPDGFEDIPKTTIECHVNANGAKSTIDTKNYSVSTNALASIEEKNNMYNLKIIDTPIIETNIYLAGFVWEDRPTALSIKEDADYTVKDENGNYIATEGLYDEGIDKLIVSKNLNGEITTERDDISSGILVSLHELTKNDAGEWYELGGYSNIVRTVTTGDTGSYKFEDLDPFAKYYVTFEMKGTYNHENYENVRFLVKSVGTDGVVEQWDSIEKALTEVKDGNSEQEEKARDIWRRNSKAVADGDQVDNGVNPNMSTTTQTEEPRGNKSELTRYDNLQLYPAYDQFTLVDSEKHKNQNGTFADYVLYYNVNSSTQTVTQNTVEADYTMTDQGGKRLVFRALSPVHDYINFGIVERPKFDLRLEKDVDKLQVQINGKDLTYVYGKKVDSGHMYTLEINEADIEKLGDMEITYKIDVTNQSTVDGYLNSIAEYYNADIMEFDSAWYVTSDGNTYKIKNERKNSEPMINRDSLIPEQYMLQGSDEVKKEHAQETGQIILDLDQVDNFKNEYKTIKAGNKLSIYVKYKYKDVKQTLDGKTNLFGKISNAGDSYVTLGLAEIYNSNSIGGRKDINSTNGNLRNKYTNLYMYDIGTFYKNFGRDFYLQGLSHEKEGEKDIDDEDAAPALKILIADPNTRKIKGSVFDDLDKDGIKNDPDREDGANSDTSIQGMTVNLYRIGVDEPVATTNTDEDGYYEFSGAAIESGDYKVEFVYGDENTILTSLYEYKPKADGSGLEEQVIKAKNAEADEWVDELEHVHYKRYNYTSYNGLEYESSYYDIIDRSGDYWYKENADKTYSDAQDTESVDKENPTKGTREYADKTLNDNHTAGKEYYMMDNEKAELLYSYRGNIEKDEVKAYIRTLRDKQVKAETEQFKINVMDTDSDTYTYYDTTESGVTQYTDGNGNIVDSTGCEADIDFGVKPRAKTNLKVTKTVDNVKIYTSSGNSNVDASYDEAKGKVVGTAGRVQWTKQANGNRGYIWIQRSEEEIIGATLEITYKIDVVNEENKITRAKNQIATIVDYVQDGMTYAEENNVGNNWHIQPATTRKEGVEKVSSIGNVNINNNIDLKDVSTVVTQDVTLKDDGTAEPVYITLTKTLNSYSNTDIDAYTNYVEVILTATPERAKLDENSIPGNFDPKLETTIEGNLGTVYDLKNKHRIIEEVPYDGIKAQSTSESIRLERDTAKALETISITAETGENRDTTYYVIAFGVIAVLATGIGVIIEKVIRRK